MEGSCGIVFVLVLIAAAASGELTNANKLEELEQVVEQVLGENEEISNRLVQLNEELSLHKQDKQTLKQRVTELEARVHLEEDESTDTVTETRRKRQLNSAWVGFTAIISPADVLNLNPGQPIIFDQIITNLGDSYNSTTGRFTAPTKGMYVFNMDILVEQGENEYLEFVKDGSHVMYNFAHAQGSLHDASSSRLVVLRLNKDNQVWVQTAPNSHHGSGKLHGNGFSTFSGWLQQVIEEPAVVPVGK